MSHEDLLQALKTLDIAVTGMGHVPVERIIPEGILTNVIAALGASAYRPLERPIVDQEGKIVGSARNDLDLKLTIHGFRDETDTVWTPPTAYAYYAVCMAARAYTAQIRELCGALKAFLEQNSFPYDHEHWQREHELGNGQAVFVLAAQTALAAQHSVFGK